MTTVSDVTTLQLSGGTHIDALLSSGPGWNWLTPTRNTLYYTFSVSSGNETGNSAISGGVSAFNASQQAAAVAILAYVGQVTGIVFAATADGSEADLHFANTNISGASTSGLCSWYRTYGYDATDTIVSYSADSYIYLDNVEWTSTNGTLNAGNDGYEALLHEIGHALGLKHPFEGGATGRCQDRCR